MIIMLIFGFLVAILNIHFVFNEHVELIVNLIVSCDSWTGGYATQIKSICQLIKKVIADFVFSVAAILKFNLNAKNMVYGLGNLGLCKLLSEISTILDFCGGYFEFCQ